MSDSIASLICRAYFPLTQTPPNPAPHNPTPFAELPLGSDAASADVEAMVGERLYEAEVSKAVLRDKVQQW